MNGFTMMCSSLGAVVLAATGVLVSPPPAGDDASTSSTLESRIFLTRKIEVVEPPRGRWEAILHPVGTLNIVVDDDGLRVQLNNKTLSSDRIAWQSDNFLMIFDETRRRQFQVKLGEGSKIEAVRPGSWLDFRTANAPRVAIGVYTAPLTPALATQLGLDLDSALLVTSVVEDMPAFKSGVQQFDIITAVDDSDGISDALLKQAVAAKEEGQTIQLHLIRRAQPVKLDVTVEAIKPIEPGEFLPGFPVFDGNWDEADITFDFDAVPVGADDLFGIQRDENPVIRFFDKEGKALILPREIVQRSTKLSETFPGQFRIGGGFEAAGDPSALARRIDALTARIAALEALIAQFVDDRGAADDAAPEDR